MQVYCDRMITLDLIPQSFRIFVPKPLSVDIPSTRLNPVAASMSTCSGHGNLLHSSIHRSLLTVVVLPFAGGCCLCSDTNELLEQGSGPIQHSDCLADILRHVHDLDHYGFSYPVSSEPSFF